MKNDKTTFIPSQLALTTELSIGTALDPSPDFVHRLRHQLLAKFPVQSHRAFITHRLTWTTLTLCVLVAGLITMLALQKPTPTKVLARTIDAIAIEPGQIVYQTYTSHDGLYQEWQRMDVTTQGHVIASKRKIVRYAMDDITFTKPEEWFYITPKNPVTSLGVKRDIRYPEQDEEGCLYRDVMDLQPNSADQTPDPLAPFAGEDLHQRLERLQANPGDLIIEETTFDENNVYALIHTELDPGPGHAQFHQHTLHRHRNLSTGRLCLHTRTTQRSNLQMAIHRPRLPNPRPSRSHLRSLHLAATRRPVGATRESPSLIRESPHTTQKSPRFLGGFFVPKVGVEPT